jgi:chloramphenicol-sensitive protein RarD
MSAHRRGVWLAVAAYGLWGVLPVYWKLLQRVPAPEILAHRILWSLVFLTALVGVRREWRTLATAFRPAHLRIYAAAAGLLAVNWLTFIWAVNTGRIVETSLGYFINPLVSVALGVLVLRERLRRGQAGCVALAGAAVVWLAAREGAPPWVALVLAGSFALYGLLKKQAPLPALPGLVLETALLALPALIFWGALEAGGRAAFGHAGPRLTLLLGFTGVVTALPLLLFAAAARQVSLTTLGLLQYLAPSLQLLIGVLVFGEPFGRDRALAFALIWTALALYWLEGVWRARRLTGSP